MTAGVQCDSDFSVIPTSQEDLSWCKREVAVSSFQKRMCCKKDYIPIDFDPVPMKIRA